MVATEKLFFAKNVKTALVIGEVRGIILAITEKHGLALKEFAPLEVKMAICGYGRADKESVANMVRLQLNLPKKKVLDDESDALAIALLALRANNVLSWPTSIVLVVVTIIIGIILKRRIKS